MLPFRSDFYYGIKCIFDASLQVLVSMDWYHWITSIIISYILCGIETYDEDKITKMI
jgi:hypothetical protein